MKWDNKYQREVYGAHTFYFVTCNHYWLAATCYRIRARYMFHGIDYSIEDLLQIYPPLWRNSYRCFVPIRQIYRFISQSYEELLWTCTALRCVLIAFSDNVKALNIRTARNKLRLFHLRPLMTPEKVPLNVEFNLHCFSLLSTDIALIV